MPAYAIWEIKKPPQGKPGPGPTRWAGSVNVPSLSAAEQQATAMMRKQGWYAVGVRASGTQTGDWKYFDCSEGPTDMKRLKSRKRRKKQKQEPGLFPSAEQCSPVPEQGTSTSGDES